jgi:hypothetical protein
MIQEDDDLVRGIGGGSVVAVGVDSNSDLNDNIAMVVLRVIVKKWITIRGFRQVL